MEVRNCKTCGRLFNYYEGITNKNICPKCVEELEEKFQEAKQYIEENPGVGITEVAAAIDVSARQVERWVREERLCFAEGSSIGVECNRCGKMIRSGCFCDECKKNITKTLGSAYGNEIETYKKKKSSEARMRFLDN